MQQNTSNSETKTRWEGYSDYRSVSQQAAQTVTQAVRAYSYIDSVHRENATLHPDAAAEARSKILAAALRLAPELRNDRDSVEQYDAILGRWEGDDGYMARLGEISLQDGCPGWLIRFVQDIQTAGWELGYMQAGRTTKAEPEDPVEGEAKAMLLE